MKIKSLECRVLRMELAEPYTIAYETIGHCTGIFLKAVTDTGITGWGSAAPDKAVTGETPDTVMQFFNQCIEPLLKGSDPWRYVRLMEEAKLTDRTAHSAHALMDMVIFDLLARASGVPLYKFLGGYRQKIATSITIGIMPVGETVAAAVKWLQEGFNILKIKGGINHLEDIDRINRVREAVGTKVKLRFDANQGYQVEEAIAFMKGTREAGIEIFEQPTPMAHENLLGMVTRNIPEPVMADESLLTLRDAFRLSRNGIADMINIKLMKVGGINEARHINSVAKSAGILSMVGCMDESALGIAAGLHFALARSNVKYADLDGHIGLMDDPFAGLVHLKKGMLFPEGGSGLGKINGPF